MALNFLKETLRTRFWKTVQRISLFSFWKIVRKGSFALLGNITQSLWRGVEELADDQGVEYAGLNWTDGAFRIRTWC